MWDFTPPDLRGQPFDEIEQKERFPGVLEMVRVSEAGDGVAVLDDVTAAFWGKVAEPTECIYGIVDLVSMVVHKACSGRVMHERGLQPYFGCSEEQCGIRGIRVRKENLYLPIGPRSAVVQAVVLHIKLLFCKYIAYLVSCLGLFHQKYTVYHKTKNK